MSCHKKDHWDIHEWVLMNNYVTAQIEFILGTKRSQAVKDSTKYNPIIALIHELTLEVLKLRGQLKLKSRKSS